jgi:hypothetical protein
VQRLGQEGLIGFFLSQQKAPVSRGFFFERVTSLN